MSSDISVVIKQQVQSVPAVLAALARMDEEVQSAGTYRQIKQVIREAEALMALYKEVEVIEHKAQITILLAKRRIGEELANVPKASGRPAKIILTDENNSGREATGIPRNTRSRYGKLARVPAEKVKETALQLQADGKDATFKAVVSEITYGDKAQRRAGRVAKMTAGALPRGLYNIACADPPWRTETWSDRGMDRSADNHYPTMSLDEIKAMDVSSIMARDALVTLWATVPHLMQAGEVLASWGFEYKSNLAWDKIVSGTGKWFWNQHEHLLVATRGDFPAPGDDQKLSSLLRERKTRHSAKPEAVLEWIEKVYPGVPKIELFRRGPARPGWAVYGAEAEPAETDVDDAS